MNLSPEDVGLKLENDKEKDACNGPHADVMDAVPEQPGDLVQSDEVLNIAGVLLACRSKCGKLIHYVQRNDGEVESNQVHPSPILPLPQRLPLPEKVQGEEQISQVNEVLVVKGK